MLTRLRTYFLRACFLLGAFFIVDGAVRAQVSVGPVVLTDSIEVLMSFLTLPYELALPVTSEHFTLEAVISGDSLPWRLAADGFESANDFYSWNKVTFYNAGTKIRNDVLLILGNVESEEVYLFEQEELVFSIEEEDMGTFPGYEIALPMSLRPGEAKTLYYHYRSQAGTHSVLSSKVVLTAKKEIIRTLILDHSLSYLYVGVMLGLVLFSLLLFGLFRERSFVFFAVMTFGFIVYFQGSKILIGLLSFSWLKVGWLIPTDIGLVVVLMACTGFIYDYLNLRQRRGWRSTIFLFFAGLSILCCLIYRIGNILHPLLYLFSNIFILLWVASGVLIIVHYALKSVAEAKVLSLSIGLLTLFGAGHAFLLLFNGTSTTFSQLFQVGSVVFSAVIFTGLYSKVNAIRDKTTQLAGQNNFITRFFTNISHEFRTPLTLMLGPVEQLLERHQAPEDQELLTTVQRNAQRQLELVNQILELSRLEATQLLLNAKNIDVVPVLRRIVSGYESLAQQRRVDLSFRTELETLVLRVETEKLETICYNLLTNAFKFTPGGGTIAVRLSQNKDVAELTIEDTGSGIKASALTHIFNRFYSDDEHQYTALAGSGVGLALTRELVRLHGGEITAASIPGEKTTFRITLPYEPGLSADVLEETPVKENTQVDVDLAHAAAVTITSPTTSKAPADAPLIVVVEDNPDLQRYLTTSLSPHYRVQVAANGREGLALIEQVMPDLVISDVMMPEMDGFEMCGLLKSRLAISHIPVILLTARSTSEDRVAGLNTGADDYLTKPFLQKELLARTRNLIESRKLLRERFAASITLKPEEVTTTSVDQEFLQAAMKAVEKNIDKEDFKVDALARELAMSRTSLNRKFRALLDQSTNQFIQNVRLERAADLLQKQDLTVSEIAMETGFSSTGYFIRSFRDKFGETPGGFRKGKEEEN